MVVTVTIVILMVLNGDMSRTKKPKKLGKDKTLVQWLVPMLRNISRMWPMKGVAQANARIRVESGEFYKNGNPIMVTKYKCAHCGNLFEKHEVDVDHITAIVDLDGFTDWDDYINRLFCPPDQLQILCKKDHTEKTRKENEQRRKLKQKKRSENEIY